MLHHSKKLLAPCLRASATGGRPQQLALGLQRSLQLGFELWGEVPVLGDVGLAPRLACGWPPGQDQEQRERPPALPPVHLGRALHQHGEEPGCKQASLMGV